MPVKYFVSQDSQGREQAPTYSHETKAVIQIINHVYTSFNNLSHLYAVIANLDDEEAAADLVIITPRGLGVIELKHYPGEISQQGTKWYAKPRGKGKGKGKRMLIKAGSRNKGYHNPHEQVQAYAEVIRNDLINVPIRQKPWLPAKRYSEREAFKFATAVCFTNEAASFDKFKKSYDQNRRRPKLKKWEQFSILRPNQIARWVVGLCFEADSGPDYRYQPYRLTAQQTMRIVTDLFGATEWTEIDGLMPTGEPYAYLFLPREDGGVTAFGLKHDEITIGRNPDCDLVIPPNFRRVSGIHAKIIRAVDGIYIQDHSTNGTFINRQPIRGKRRLIHGQQITFGGQQPSDRVCLLEFSRKAPDTSSTEIN